MLFPYISALAIFAPMVSAVGSVTIYNNCPQSIIYIWSVGSAIPTNPWVTLPENTYYEQFHEDPVTGGISIKILTSYNGLYDGNPQMDLAYTVDPDASKVWYDLSDIDGDPFAGNVVNLESPGCPGVTWPNGVRPIGAEPMACDIDAQLNLFLCGGSLA